MAESSKGRSALVTGSSGFLGRHVVARLREEGWSVTGFDRVRGDAADREADVTDAAAVAAALEDLRPEVVYHLAGIAFVPANERDPSRALAVNTGGTLHVLEAARRLDPPPRVIVVSSAEAYGAPPCDGGALREDHPLRPRNLYGATKAAAEVLTRLYASRGVPAILVRPFNHIGPGQAPDFVCSSFARQVARAERSDPPPPIRVGNLEARRDFVDVRDAAGAYPILATRGTPGEAYNLASGHAVSIREVLDILLELASRPIAVETDPARFRPADTIRGDPTKASRELGWSARIRLRDSLAAILDDWRARVRGEPAPGVSD